MGYYNKLRGHMVASKTYANARGFFYGSGMFDWICALTADRRTCQNIKPKTKHLNDVALEERHGDTALFCAIHIDHKGPLHPPSNRKTHCLLRVDFSSPFAMVYFVTHTRAQTTIAASKRWILHFGTPHSKIHDRITAFFNTHFVNWTKVLGIAFRPRTAHSPWTNGKMETHNQKIGCYWGSFLNDTGTNWAFLAPKCAFAHKTSGNYTTGKTCHEIVFGAEPQNPLSVKLRIYRNKQKLCCSDLCTDLLPLTDDENSTKNKLLQKLLRPQLSQALLDQERDFKRIYCGTLERCREQTARSHAYRTIFQLGHHLNIG